MGVGMCVCLRRANRLIPNRFSFPLVDRGDRRERGFHNLGAEEEGLLSHYSDMEDEDDAEIIDNQNALHSARYPDDVEDEEGFGHLQSHNNAIFVNNHNNDNDSNKDTD
ncbi:hypothetical protein [Parasitella parasitica]|uniref:Uncharacterized protein n=1 Tax=Parasitella parasitica TaxID=35722 RepID=A0A0B7NVU5_9FUNG|nr:hypothetical protein [Parasitella parasitica]